MDGLEEVFPLECQPSNSSSARHGRAGTEYPNNPMYGVRNAPNARKEAEDVNLYVRHQSILPHLWKRFILGITVLSMLSQLVVGGPSSVHSRREVSGVW